MIDIINGVFLFLFAVLGFLLFPRLVIVGVMYQSGLGLGATIIFGLFALMLDVAKFFR